ncbi:MAG: hypothetical protein AB7W47_12165 [Calditrichaceae bacterium]
MNLSEMIQQISMTESRSQKMEWLHHLAGSVTSQKARMLIPLLYDNDPAVRLETAYLIENYGLKLNNEEQFRYLFALQDFDTLATYLNDSEARVVIFQGLREKNLRLRARLLRVIHESDCQSEEERLIFYYGRAEYDTLIQRYHDETADDRVKKFIAGLLENGTKPSKNTDYHRRQCAQALKEISEMDLLGDDVKKLLSPTAKIASDVKLKIRPEIPEPYNALEPVLEKLNRQGVIVSGRHVFPEIRVGTVTGRITYRNPGLQTWPEEKRMTEIQPPDGYKIWRYDYAAIEPNILLNILLGEHLLSLDDVPRGDIYTAICSQKEKRYDRGEIKRYLNGIINGASVMPPFTPQPFLWRLIEAMDELRTELRDRAKPEGGVTTIGGKFIGLDPSEANYNGKLMNRLIQGSASDLFNRGLIEIDRRIQSEKTDLRISFVLFDEVWIAAGPSVAESWEENILEILNRQWKNFHLPLPVTARRKR